MFDTQQDYGGIKVFMNNSCATNPKLSSPVFLWIPELSTLGQHTCTIQFLKPGPKASYVVVHINTTSHRPQN